jgi:hypothetical protein
MENLKPVLSQYLEVNKRLADLNKSKAGELRDQRSTLELDLTAAYATRPSVK